MDHERFTALVTSSTDSKWEEGDMNEFLQIVDWLNSMSTLPIIDNCIRSVRKKFQHSKDPGVVYNALNLTDVIVKVR